MTGFTPEAGPAAGSLGTEHADASAADLRAGIAGLASLVTGSLGLDELLGRVATFARNAIPGADGAGVTLLELAGHDHRVDALAASDPFVAEIDEIQYVLVKEGPCITAALEGRTVRSGSLGGEKMWPRFGPRVGRLGVHSALSLPLLVQDKVIGAMNVYARPRDSFDDRAEHLGELFAVPAAIAVQNAQILAETRRLATNLQAGLINRAVIDQAIGIIISRTGITPEQAFDRIRRTSAQEHIKVSVVATSIVEAAARRARARTGHPDHS
jgi:GAF domain-containing protein